MPNVTSNGKEIEVVPLNGYNLFKVQFNSGGQLPKELKGTFTKAEYAQKAIDKYLDSKAKESKVSAKSAS